MKNIMTLFLFILSINAYSMSQEEIITSTHVYNDLAIQTLNVMKNNQFYINKIIISKAKFENIAINNNNFKTPEVNEPIWVITPKNLQVPEEACLDIDATLCKTYAEIHIPNDSSCYNQCIGNNLMFVAYDEKNHLLYFDAGSDVSGTASEPRFLFVANINTRKITYLNTFDSPYYAYLSTKGNYLAILGNYGGLEICNTHSGDKFQLNENDFSYINKLFWVNDTTLQYEEKFNKNHIMKEKTYDMKIFDSNRRSGPTW